MLNNEYSIKGFDPIKNESNPFHKIIKYDKTEDIDSLEVKYQVEKTWNKKWELSQGNKPNKKKDLDTLLGVEDIK